MYTSWAFASIEGGDVASFGGECTYEASRMTIQRFENGRISKFHVVLQRHDRFPCSGVFTRVSFETRELLTTPLSVPSQSSSTSTVSNFETQVAPGLQRAGEDGGTDPWF